MGLVLNTIPDSGLSLRVVFTTLALCMVTALVLVQRGVGSLLTKNCSASEFTVAP